MFSTYILPILLVTGIAVLFGFLLSYLGSKFAVVRNPKIDEVLSHLSGANCGGCGFPGCDAFAQALVDGKAELSACNPTGKDAKVKISEILGIADDSEETIAVVHCCGGDKCKDKYEYQGYGTCVTAELLAGGRKACPTGCMGLGTCSDACGYNAISLIKGNYPTVDADLCTSCGACIAACPKDIISRLPKSAPVYVACKNPGKLKEVSSICPVGCIGCGVCAKMCPHGAITMQNNLPVFDYTKCTGCFVCAQKCPTKVIKRNK